MAGVAKIVRRIPMYLLMCLPMMLAGCDIMGKGTTQAVFTLPPKARVLVAVDPRPTSGMPIDGPIQMGKLITDELVLYKGAELVVDQGRLTDLRRDPDYKKMGIADIAVATGADVVIYVDVLTFHVATISDGQVTQGDATATVKVVDRNGTRLWPPLTDVLGFQVQTSVLPGFTDQMPPDHVKNKMVKDLAAYAARLFYKYDREDKDMNPHP